MGRFIVIDGLDGSGKETQAILLRDALLQRGIKVRLLSFPCYDSESSAFVKMYLSGKLGTRPDDTNAYAASSFFAADRYISYRTDWKEAYDDPDTVIIANRYTTANAVHQLAKLPEDAWFEFLDWLWDYEFKRLGIPMPSDIIYLEMKPEISMKLIAMRAAETGREIDIHEADAAFLENSYRAALFASKVLRWNQISCYRGDLPISRQEIHSRIMEILGY